MRKLLGLAILMVVGLQPMLKAQQRMRYSQYLLNPYLTNPALTGIEPYWDIRAGAAQQWVGFDGAPKSIYLTAHKGLYSRGKIADTKPTLNINSLPSTGRMRTLPTTSEGPSRKTELEEVVEKLDISDPRSIPAGPNFHMGAGFQVFSEKTGPISYTGVAASIAANVRVVGGLRMSIGANMEMLNYRLNPNSINFLQANDVVIPYSQASLMFPSLNAGFALYSQRFFLMGSTRQLMRSRITTNPNNPVVSGLETHYWAQAGLRLKAARNINLLPSIALRQISPAPPSLDLSLQGAWKETVYLGLSYRHEDALVFLAGFRFTPELRLDYAYDYTVSDLGGINSGSHSLVLSFFPRIVPKLGRKYFW